MNLWKVPFPPPEGGELPEPQRVTLSEGHDIGVSAASDGLRLAFTKVRNTPDIWELTVAGRSLRQVTSATGRENSPHLSPDGQTLVVSADVGGTNTLWTIDLAGRFLNRLLPGPAAYPRWSPDGTQVAYNFPTDDGTAIATRKLGDVTADVIVDLLNAFAPQWSPDGTLVTFAGVADDSAMDIWVANVATKESRRLTERETAIDIFPTFSPGGNRIAFSRQEAEPRHIWIVPTEGGEATQLTHGDWEYSHPNWSPIDPDTILVVLDHKSLGLLSVSTGEVEQITDPVSSTVIVDYPGWSADGKKIYFSITPQVGDLYVLENY